MAHCRGSEIVHRVEGFDRKFRQTDIQRSTENGRCADKGQDIVGMFQLQWNSDTAIWSGGTGRIGARADGNGQGGQFLQKFDQGSVTCGVDLLFQALKDMMPPLPDIAYSWGQPIRMQAEPQDIDRWFEQERIDIVQKGEDGAVG